MDVNKMVMEILQYLIEVGIAALVPVVIKYILTKINKARLEKYSTLALIVVKAVQQSIGSGNGAAKKVEAEKRLSAMTKGKLSVEMIDSLIECAVHELNQDVKAELDKAPDAPAAVVDTKQ